MDHAQRRGRDGYRTDCRADRYLFGLKGVRGDALIWPTQADCPSRCMSYSRAPKLALFSDAFPALNLRGNNSMPRLLSCRSFSPIVTLAAVVGALAISALPAASAGIHVFTSGAPAAVEKMIADSFARSTGAEALITVGNLSAIQDKLSAGESPDVVIFPTSAIEALEKAGTVVSGSRVDLARVGIGIAVREGTPLPDISSAEAVRKLLLDARSVVYPDPKGGGFTGAHISRVITQMGIAEAVAPKTTLLFAIGGGVEAVASDKVEVGIFNISEILPIKGVTLVGPLPAEMQSYINFSGAIYVGSKSPDSAKAFLSRLSSAQSRIEWQKGGFEQIGQAR
jgi:molybdate transport system substrate-binding protein